MLFLIVVSIAMSVYRSVEVTGFTRGVPLTLRERNAYIVYEMLMVTSMLAAFVLPSLRVFVRRKKERGRGEGGAGGEEGGGKAGRGKGGSEEGGRFWLDSCWGVEGV